MTYLTLDKSNHFIKDEENLFRAKKKFIFFSLAIYGNVKNKVKEFKLRTRISGQHGGSGCCYHGNSVSTLYNSVINVYILCVLLSICI